MLLGVSVKTGQEQGDLKRHQLAIRLFRVSGTAARSGPQAPACTFALDGWNRFKKDRPKRMTNPILGRVPERSEPQSLVACLASLSLVLARCAGGVEPRVPDAHPAHEPHDQHAAELHARGARHSQAGPLHLHPVHQAPRRPQGLHRARLHHQGQQSQVRPPAVCPGAACSRALRHLGCHVLRTQRDVPWAHCILRGSSWGRDSEGPDWFPNTKSSLHICERENVPFHVCVSFVRT